ncbi:hypothetical protein, partial [Clostridium perfringens]
FYYSDTFLLNKNTLPRIIASNPINNKILTSKVLPVLGNSLSSFVFLLLLPLELSLILSFFILSFLTLKYLKKKDGFSN